MKKLLTIACAAIAALSFNSCNTADENDAFKTAVAERITKSSETPAAGNTITKPKYDTVYNVTAENIVEKLTEIKTGLDTGGGTQPAEFELKITGPFSKADYMKIKSTNLLWSSTFNGTNNPVRIGLDFSSANLSDDMITSAGLYDTAGNIKSVVFPKRVSDGLRLGGTTLSWLPFLEYVKLPDNLAYLPTSAFIQLYSETQDVSLQIEIPSGITSITADAFYNSRNLTKILLHEGIQSIGYEAFFMCTKLKSIELPSTLISLESCAFQRCSSLKEVKLNKGLTSIGSYAFNYCTSLESINIPSSVTKIESSAFERCTALKEVKLNEGLTSIGSSAFSYCTSLESINIPSTVTRIEYSAFERCSALKEVKLNEGLTTIGNKAFATCIGLKSIDIPSTVETIGGAAFSESGLRSIKIPETVKTLGGSALYNCTNLESFEINTKIFPGYTVTRCSSLKSIVIGENVEEIKSWYAADIPNLKSVTFKNPNGWKINGTSVSSDDLKDPEKAANIFKANYYRAWTRN